MKVENTIWNEVVQELEKETPKEEFDTWFRNIKDISTNKNLILLEVPSAFHRDQVRIRYLSKIQEIIAGKNGGGVPIDFIVKDFPKSEKTNTIKKGEIKTERSSFVRKGAASISSGVALNTEYTFENFVIGDNNRFAANAALAVSKNPGTAYNPCLIYGGVGLGKTHLLQSIGNAIKKNFDNMKVTYLTAEDFTNSFIRAIQENKTHQFKNEYRHTDLLLIDDIHFLQKKHETQEELFHTFNTLFNAKKQMVFTSDRPISETRDITERLQNRFTRGLTVDLQPPKIETAIAILKKKLSKTNIVIPEDVIVYICNEITTNIRDLEAALTKIIAYTELIDSDITLDIAREQLKSNITNKSQSNITIGNIQRCVSDYFNVSSSDIKGKKRNRSITFPRHLSMFLARELTESSLTDIGLEFGGRDHTTVIHACDRIENKIRSDSSVSDTIDILKRKIKQKIL